MRFYQKNFFKPFGYLPPKQENKIILYCVIGILLFAAVYILSFYVKR